MKTVFTLRVSTIDSVTTADIRQAIEIDPALEVVGCKRIDDELYEAIRQMIESLGETAP